MDSACDCIVAEAPRPASLEKTPRARPLRMVADTAAPAKPPMAAWPVNAPLKMEAKTAPMLPMFAKTSEGIRNAPHWTLKSEYQQRGSHRRLGNAHGARDDPEAASFRRARNAPWAALAGCIMPPNLFGHTTSSLHVRQAAMRWG